MFLGRDIHSEVRECVWEENESTLIVKHCIICHSQPVLRLSSLKETGDILQQKGKRDIDHIPKLANGDGT